jgi:multiple sugar transport system substrate-binding protein
LRFLDEENICDHNQPGDGGGSGSLLQQQQHQFHSTVVANTGTTSTATTTGTSSSDPVNTDKNITANVRIGFAQTELGETYADFNKIYPNIKVTEVANDYNSQMTMCAAGNGADLLRMFGATEAPSYIAKGLCTDLTPYIANSSTYLNDTSDYESVMSLYMFDGTTQGKGPLYGIPKDWSPDITLFYNKKILDAAGVPYPSATTPMTWQDLFAAAKKCVIQKGSNVTQWGLCFFGGTTLTCDFNIDADMTMLYQQGQPNCFSSDMKSCQFNTPANVAILNLWNTAVQDNLGPNGKNGSTNWGGDVFCNGTCAFWETGYWAASAFANNSYGNQSIALLTSNSLGMAPCPCFAGGTRYSPCEGATGAAIWSGSKNKAAAWDFLSYFFAGPGNDARTKGGWGVPPYKHLMSEMPTSFNGKYTDFYTQCNQVVTEEIPYTTPPLPYDYYITPSSMANAISQDINPLYFGKTDATSALTQLTTDTNTLIQSGMEIIGANN